jgi:endonuclease/exonuclease/phosphatase family metal-dependent hydrolase
MLSELRKNRRFSRASSRAPAPDGPGHPAGEPGENRNSMKKKLCAAALFFCIAPAAFPLTLMSYNVENLFDDVQNGTEYREFNPQRGWNAELFKARIESIAEVVRKAVPGGADVLLFQEIENENALGALVKNGLSGMGYSWTVMVPKNGLSANVAMLSRIPVARVRAHAVGPWKGATVRDVIEADIEMGGHTLYVFNDHWKSKTGGVRASEPSRLESSAVLARRVREILAQDPAADILAAGDFNENVDEYARTGRKYQTAFLPAGGDRGIAADAGSAPGAFASRSIYLSSLASRLGATGDRLVLYEPWFETEKHGRGSYFYQGDWLTVDHILLSPGLLDSRGFVYRHGSFGPVKLDFLLAPGGAPKRWKGVTGPRGYSDHLPLVITLDFRK